MPIITLPCKSNTMNDTTCRHFGSSRLLFPTRPTLREGRRQGSKRLGQTLKGTGTPLRVAAHMCRDKATGCRQRAKSPEWLCMSTSSSQRQQTARGSRQKAEHSSRRPLPLRAAAASSQPVCPSTPATVVGGDEVLPDWRTFNQCSNIHRSAPRARCLTPEWAGPLHPAGGW